MTWILILLVISAIANAFMDLCAHEALKKWGDWWAGHESWINKYKNGDPDQGPRFPLSTTVFVWVTDGWHFFQAFFHFGWMIAFIWYAHIYGGLEWYWEALILFIGWRSVFQVSYWIIQWMYKLTNQKSK